MEVTKLSQVRTVGKASKKAAGGWYYAKQFGVASFVGYTFLQNIRLNGTVRRICHGMSTPLTNHSQTESLEDMLYQQTSIGDWCLQP